MVSLATKASYRKFTDERDRALERILDKYLVAVSEELTFAHAQVIDFVTASHTRGNVEHTHAGFREKEELYRKVDFLFKIIGSATVELFRRMRRSVYTLAHAGEAEAIGRALVKDTKFNLGELALMRAQNQEAPAGGDLRLRLELYFDRLKRDILTAIDMSFVMSPEPLSDVIARIDRAFPHRRVVKRRPRALKESNHPLYGRTSGQKSMATGIVDDATWNDMVDDYTKDQLPPDTIRRGPDDVVKMPDSDVRYEWEVENELMEDFVSQVRDGQGEAGLLAKAQGVEDMMWVAIIDKVTDECCVWRDGLTSKEIAEKLEGEHSDDESDATIPPAHFNCRCKPAPVTKDFPEVEAPSYEDFNSWLTT